MQVDNNYAIVYATRSYHGASLMHRSHTEHYASFNQTQPEDAQRNVEPQPIAGRHTLRVIMGPGR